MIGAKIQILRKFVNNFVWFFNFNKFLVELLDNENLYSDKGISIFKFKTNLDYKDISERNIDVRLNIFLLNFLIFIYLLECWIY